MKSQGSSGPAWRLGLKWGALGGAPGEEGGVEWGVWWVSSCGLLSHRMPSRPHLSSCLRLFLPGQPPPPTEGEREGGRKGVLKASPWWV